MQSILQRVLDRKLALLRVAHMVEWWNGYDQPVRRNVYGSPGCVKHLRMKIESAYMLTWTHVCEHLIQV